MALKLLAILLVPLCLSAQAEDITFEQYETISHIPEPMQFDLVRELGAHKGEWEINTLFQQEHSLLMHQTHLAPEIEVVVADGLGLEAELPMEGTTVASYKAAAQYTLGHMGAHDKMIHGLQLIGEKYAEGDHHLEATALYLFGHRLAVDWSYLLMLGDRYYADQGRDFHRVVVNWTLFYTFSEAKQIEFALEHNLLGLGHDFDYYRVTPEIHIFLQDKWKLQMGVGGLFTHHRWETSSGLRIVKEFY